MSRIVAHTSGAGVNDARFGQLLLELEHRLPDFRGLRSRRRHEILRAVALVEHNLRAQAQHKSRSSAHEGIQYNTMNHARAQISGKMMC